MHTVGTVLKDFVPGEAVFPGISAQEALVKLRFMLSAIRVEKPELYRCHDIRRGHALDLQCAGMGSGVSWVYVWWFSCPGAPLWEILEAGEWSSPAFLKYLDLHRLDAELVVQAHAGESDSDDA